MKTPKKTLNREEKFNQMDKSIIKKSPQIQKKHQAPYNKKG